MDNKTQEIVEQTFKAIEAQMKAQNNAFYFFFKAAMEEMMTKIIQMKETPQESHSQPQVP